MTRSGIVMGGVGLLLALAPRSAGVASAADDPPAGEGSVAAINAQFDQERKALEARHLERLAALAAAQEGAEAAATYEAYFRAAIDAGLFAEAEPVAEAVLGRGEAPPRVASMAALTKVLGEAGRGAYQESYESLLGLLGAGPEGRDAIAAALPLSTRLTLIEAYDQRLVQAGQFELAAKALRAIEEKATDPAVRDLVAARLRALDLLGKPAPPIVGEDVDGRPFDLATLKGDVVLVVFWASWCVPNADQADRLAEVLDKYRDRGFRVVGVNLDALQEGVDDPGDVLPFVRRFLVEHNVRWPNLLNGRGDRDFAAAYGVTEIPASFLVGRDGTIVHLDLNRANFESAVADALGR